MRTPSEPVATASFLSRLAERIGAHRVPNRSGHEREQSLWRAVVGGGLASIWVTERLLGVPAGPPFWFLLALLTYGLAGLACRRRQDESAFFLYAFLVFDPILVIGVLAFDPQTFAFLHPVLLVVVVRAGLRYGIRTLYLSWAAALVASTGLLASEFWTSRIELVLSFFLMLALVPLFFASVIGQIHHAGTLEEERARSVALHELALARSAFLAKLSHELRSPLQGIVSALDVIELRHARAFEGDHELIGRMRRSSMLLNAQLRDLLTLAKGEAGRLAMHPEAFEACALVEAMAQGTRELALARGLELVVDLPPGPLFVLADGARVDQVLTNLVVNSIRYTNVGHVRVAMQPLGNPPSGLRFVVDDTGPGIPEALLPTLFEPDRFINSPARRGEGSGIGLAIVRTLVEHLGGTLEVTSQLGEGTTFTVLIPVAPVEPNASRTPDRSVW